MDIPGFPCEKLLDGRRVKASRDKIKFAAEEEDPGAVVGEGAKASRVGLKLLDPAVETFGGGVGNRRPSQVSLRKTPLNGDVYAHSRRLRDAVRISAGDADDRHAQRALLALSRSGALRLPGVPGERAFFYD